jgi:nitrite reductase/ring-hydroxylating ferredoxin subunit
MATGEEQLIPDWQRDFPYRQDEARLVTRREFSRMLCIISAAMVTGSAYVVARAYWPSGGPAGKFLICGKDELPAGGTKPFQLPGSNTPYILVHLENGTFKAYEQKCTHLSCAVFYKAGTGKIECPCHNGWFDANTGDVLQGPPPRPLPALQVIEEQHNIFVIGPGMEG